MCTGAQTFFKQCSYKMLWKDLQEFLSDAQVEIIGYQVDFEKLEEGFFMFNHIACGTTIAVKVPVFFGLYKGPIYRERKTGSAECPRYCLYKNNLNECPARCECAYIRKIIQIIKNWKKSF